MIDLHCHVLPGVDDGPRELEDSLALCRASAKLGVTKIVATPHVSWEYDNTAADISGRCVELNAELAAAGIDLTVMPGAEVAISKAVELDDEELRALRLGGGPWLLAEPPFTPSAAIGLEAMIHSLRSRGHQLLIAHPERCPAFLENRARLKLLVDDGSLCSVTAGALVGRFGKHSRRFAEDLIAEGLAHNVASDAHGLGRRPPGMAKEIRTAGLASQTAWLCQAAPQAILAGTALPARPPIERRSTLKRLFKA